MSKRRVHSAESIIRNLRKAEVMLGEGKKVKDICKSLGISDNTYYKWRKEYGGMTISQSQRMKDLEQENSRLKRAVADLTLDNLILKDFKEGKL